ncbi:MAG: S8 family serine peptidase [Alphaproteobacteria bacterium]|nr:S8 family serine peptidase [Alphaproteobacteria bacterium]
MKPLACLLLLLCVVYPAAAEAQGWTVLEYDANGRVVGSRNNTSDAGDDDSVSGARQQAVEPNELLVVDPTAGQLAELRGAGFGILRRSVLTGLGFTLVEISTPPGMSVPEAMSFISDRYPELLVETNDLLDLSGNGYRDRQQAQSIDFTRDLSGWGDVPDSCGAGIVLGQIDGFVDVDHAALRGKKLIYESFLKPDRVPAAEDHGTAVAVMLIGRAFNDRSSGLLPGAKLFAANIFERRNGKDVGNLAALVRAIDWLATNNVRVANLSIAGGDNKIMRLAINRALQKGLLLVAAAGNNGPNAPPAWPAAHPDSFAVTAIDKTMRLYRHANRGAYIDFAAPGVDIPTQTPRGLKNQSGTSFAAPFVTAMVALHLDAGFEADPELIRRSLQRYSMDLGTSGKDDVYGWGLVRLRPSC